MCEKGAYGSLINSRVLSCEVLRGKAATAEMAGAMSEQPRPLPSVLGGDAFSKGTTRLGGLGQLFPAKYLPLKGLRESTQNLTNVVFI